MSLYYEAAKVLEEVQNERGSLKSIIFGGKPTRSSRAQLYALVSETIRWSAELSGVVEKAGLLAQERKVGGNLCRPQNGRLCREWGKMRV